MSLVESIPACDEGDMLLWLARDQAVNGMGYPETEVHLDRIGGYMRLASKMFAKSGAAESKNV